MKLYLYILIMRTTSILFTLYYWLINIDSKTLPLKHEIYDNAKQFDIIEDFLRHEGTYELRLTKDINNATFNLGLDFIQSYAMFIYHTISQNIISLWLLIKGYFTFIITY